MSIDELVADLARLGVRPGDVMMVHASLRAIGPAAGGAGGLVDALDQAVGDQGTVLMVLGARDDWAWVNDRPEADRLALLADADPFDALTTPADPDVGALAECFRQTPGTVVSDHPEARFGARGRLADHLVADPPWDDYYSVGSTLERLVEADGRVLRLGADTDTVTLTHYAEYLTSVPDKRRVRRHRRVRSTEGAIIRVVDSLDDSNGIVDRSGEDYFTTILMAYLSAVAVPTARVGGADSELIQARDYVTFATTWMDRHLAG